MLLPNQHVTCGPFPFAWRTLASLPGAHPPHPPPPPSPAHSLSHTHTYTHTHTHPTSGRSWSCGATRTAGPAWPTCCTWTPPPAWACRTMVGAGALGWAAGRGAHACRSFLSAGAERLCLSHQGLGLSIGLLGERLSGDGEGCDVTEFIGPGAWLPCSHAAEPPAVPTLQRPRATGTPTTPTLPPT